MITPSGKADPICAEQRKGLYRFVLLLLYILTTCYQGGKNRRRGKNENEDDKRELIFREDGQEYAQVIKMLGNGRLEAQCFDGEKRLAHIRGKMRKKVGGDLAAGIRSLANLLMSDHIRFG